MYSPRVINYRRLYSRTTITIDILCLVGLPIVLGVLVNYVLGIGLFAFIGVVTVLRKRFLDDKTEKLVLGVVPNGRQEDEMAASPREGRGPIRIMAFAAALAGHWFMLGDNRGESDDSRFYGPVPTSWIIGHVVYCRTVGVPCPPAFQSRKP